MSRLSDKIFLFVILVACGSVLFRNLDSLSIRMWDESRNAINAIEMLESHNPIVVLYDGSPDLWNTKPPFLTWCMAVTMKVIGINELSVRLPSAMAALITCLLVFLILYDNSDKNIFSVFGSIALVTFPGFIDYHIARNGDFDSMLAMWVFLSAVFFYRWIIDENANLKYLCFAVLAIVGGVLTKSIAALLIIPGFVVFAVLIGQTKRLFSLKPLLIASALFLIPSLTYYFIREMNSPGFLSAVLENELFGRYLNIQEEHEFTTWFYFENLFNGRLGIWIYFLPVAVLSYFLIGRKTSIGKLMLFGMVCALMFLLVITSSKTKLPWYDATAFPFIGIVVAGGLILIFQKIEQYFLNSRNIQLVKFRYLIAIVLGVFPFINVHSKTSVKAVFEQTYPELFYGDMIKAFFSTHAGEKLTVVYEGYNSHALFYIKSYRMKGERIVNKSPESKFIPGEMILTCETPVYDKLKNRYRLDTFYRNDSRIISRVIEEIKFDASEISDNLVSKLNDTIAKIVADTAWANSVKEKANTNGISYEDQLKADAIYVLQTEKVISEQEAILLKQH